MKLKVRPDDFIVDEIASLPLQKQAGFGVYLLKKYGCNTVELLHRLSKELKIPYRSFSYGGRKDKYAKTCQYIGIKSAKKLNMETKNYSIEFVGWMDRPMGPDLVLGNKFVITVRKLSPAALKKAKAQIAVVENSGVPNYFDDQRFGSYHSKQGFLAEKIIKGHFNGALKIYLTFIHPEDKKEAKERKRYFWLHWKNWEECLKRAKTNFEKVAFGFLCKNPEGFLPVLQRISQEEMSLYFSVYQSYLWNAILRKIIRLKTPSPLNACKGLAGDYVFYQQLDKENFNYFNNLTLPLAASKTKMPDKLTQEIYAEILKHEGVKPAMFNLRKIRQAFFKAVERRAIVFPRDIRYNCAEDDIYIGKGKLTLEFSFLRGSFATMLIKRLFS